MRHQPLFMFLLTLALLATAPALQAADAPASKPSTAPADGAKTFTGILHGGMMGAGGEHSGYELEMADGKNIEVSFGGRMRFRADAFDGKKVTITGAVRMVEGTERRREVLMANTIAEAKE